jgi:hypothetical protein
MATYTAICRNVKVKEPKNGGPFYRTFGLVIKGGERDGEWLNLSTFPESEKEFARKKHKTACKTMGVTNDTPEGFKCDGRLVIVVTEMNGKWENVVGIFPHKESKLEVKQLMEDDSDESIF